MDAPSTSPRTRLLKRARLALKSLIPLLLVTSALHRLAGLYLPSDFTAGLSPDEKAIVLLAELRSAALQHAEVALLLTIALLAFPVTPASRRVRRCAWLNTSTVLVANLTFLACITFAVLAIRRML